MSGFINDIRIQFSNAKALYRLLAINIVIFLVLTLARTFFFLFHTGEGWLNLLMEKISLTPSLKLLMYQPWSLFTYMFVHVELMHILFNLLVLFWTGKLFIEYLGNEKLIATYLMGGITGGLFYILFYNLLPAFNGYVDSAHLIGASAGVIAILVAIATLIPDYTVFLILFGPVKLKYIAIISIVIYAISIPNGNAGGQIAHLGGALWGYIYIKQLKVGRNLGAPVQYILNLFNRKKPVMKVVMRSEKNTGMPASDLQESVDRILDKINRSGFDSLTKQEKDILYKASGRKS